MLRVLHILTLAPTLHSCTSSHSGSFRVLSAFSYRVRFWHLSLAHSTLAHGCILAALARALNSRTRPHSGSFRALSAFPHRVGFWHLLSPAVSNLPHSRILAALTRTL